MKQKYRDALQEIEARLKKAGMFRGKNMHVRRANYMDTNCPLCLVGKSCARCPAFQSTNQSTIKEGFILDTWCLKAQVVYWSFYAYMISWRQFVKKYKYLINETRKVLEETK